MMPFDEEDVDTAFKLVIIVAVVILTSILAWNWTVLTLEAMDMLCR